MKSILLSIFVLFALAFPVTAQTGTFFEAGIGGSYGSNSREKSFPELFGGAGVKVAEFKDSTVQLRFRGKLSKTPELADLFTRDNNPLRRPTGELRLSPEVRWNLSTESYFKPFVGAGLDYYRHFGLNGAPQSGLNPTLTFGTRVGYGYEVFYTRIFEDRLNRAGFPVQSVKGVLTGNLESSRLRGDRIGASYLFKVSGRFHIKTGLEADRVSYRACANTACDAYREKDFTVRPFVVVSIF